MPIYVLEGDDHERRAATADDEATARQAVADAFNLQYRPGEEEDTGTPYDGSEFTLVAIRPDGDEVDAELI
jgi:hypothetical protein